MSRIFKFSSLAAVSVAAVMTASAAQAGGFGIREQSAQAQGLSFAGAASGTGGLSSMFWNPAAVTMRPGWNSDMSFSAILPTSNVAASPVGTFAPMQALGLDAGNIGIPAIVASSYGNMQINDRLFLGFSFGAPFGLSTKPKDVWAGQFYGRSSKVFSLAFNPVVGYKVNDWLAIAGGPVFEYFSVRLKSAAGIAPTSASLALEGDNTGIGFTAGVILTPMAGTTIGVGYRSSIHHELVGTHPLIPGGIKANLNTPEKISVGITQAITQSFRVSLGFEWDNWSRLGLPPIRSAVTGAPVSLLPLKYRDGYMYSIGGEYDINSQWTVRAGLAYEVSPVDDATRSVRLPDADRIWASLGASYNWNNKLSFDVSYSHLFVSKARISITPGNPTYTFRGTPFPLTLVGEAKSSIDIISVGMKYRWDDPKVAEPAKAVVRKY